MRKLKLQMQLSVNGFVCGPNGEMDWMTWTWDDAMLKYVQQLHEPVDLIVMGRKLAKGFIPHWANAVKNEQKDDPFAHKMVDIPKVVFTKTLETSPWDNATLAKGDLTEEITRLKNQPGKDMITYGGAGFATNLIKAGLIDELHLFINPAAIGSGMTIFSEKTDLKLLKVSPFECGIVVLTYEPIKK